MRIRCKEPRWIAVLFAIMLGACTGSGTIDLPSRTGSGTTGTTGTTGTSGATDREVGEPAPVVEAPAPMPMPAPAPVAETRPPEPGPPDSSAEAGRQKIVYNALLSPQLPRAAGASETPVLQLGAKTTLGFDIGPKRDGSVIEGEVSEEISGGSEDLLLTIIFGCNFCPPSATFEQDIVFRRKERRSEWIEFEFTPEARRDGNNYNEELHLLVVNRKTARAIDRLTIPVRVEASSLALSSGQPAESLSLVGASRKEATSADVDLTIYATAAEGPAVTFSFEPGSAAMKKLLGRLVTDERGTPRRFRTGVVNTDLTDQESGWSFTTMSAAALQQAELTQLPENKGVSPGETGGYPRLGAGEARKLADAMAKTGKYLYRNLFHRTADKKLAEIIRLLEQRRGPSQERLKVKIFTDRLHLPWQYLHPTGPEVDPWKFWGMNFSLSVVRSDDGGGIFDEDVQEPQSPKILFAHYGTETDPTVRLALAHIAALQAALPATDVFPVDTGGDLINRLKSDKDSISGLITFMHASVGDGASGPLIEFGEADKVEARQFSELVDNVQADQQNRRYLSLGPLVVLNACETGPAMRLTRLKLPDSLFDLGARGVIVTEVSVAQALGDSMAKRLMGHLIKGETAADALTAARRELLTEENNPLGLLYAYYGDSTAKLISASRKAP